jgi:sulfur-carrier protein adenylyltransferase/sulfurtransferase
MGLPLNLDAASFDQLIGNDAVQLIDVRNRDELPRVDDLHALCIPMNELKKSAHLLDRNKTIILFCHSGIRTLEALDIIQEEFHMNNVCHLKGGLMQWMAYQARKNF